MVLSHSLMHFAEALVVSSVLLTVLIALCTDDELMLRSKPLRDSSSTRAARRWPTPDSCFCFWREVLALVLAAAAVAVALAPAADRVLADDAVVVVEEVNLRTLAADAAVGLALRQQFSLPSNGRAAAAAADDGGTGGATGGATGGS